MGAFVAWRGGALSPERAGRADRRADLCKNRASRPPTRQMPASEKRNRNARTRWRISPVSWLIVPAGVALGVLLFLLVWMQREVPEAADEAMLPGVTVSADAHAPALPAPQVPGEELEAGGEDTAAGVFTLPEAPAQPPPTVAGSPQPEAIPGDMPPGAEQPGGEVISADRGAVAVHSPPPDYPARSLRRGDSGEVLVRVLVGADGQPRQVEVARSSSHRALDQAAVRAVRRWRFEPATRQGQRVSQVVHVPVSFSP